MGEELPELPLEVPNLSIAYLLRELEPLVVGAFIERAQDLEKNWFKLRLRSKNGTLHLVFSPKGFFVANYRVDARQQSSGFGAFLGKRIQGKKILSLEQLGSERIVKLSVEGFALVAELFGKGNLLLLDSDGKILKPYKRESWRARTLAKGEAYQLPPKRGVSPAELKLEDFISLLGESEGNAVRAVIAGVNMPPVLAEEVFTRAPVSTEASASTLSSKQVKALYSEISKLYSMPALEGECACLVVHSSKRVLLPFKPKNKLEVLAQYDSLNDALNELLLVPFLKPATKENRKKQELERTLREQLQALEASERAEKENRRKAELIYAHYPALVQAVNKIRTLQGKKKEHIMYKFLSGVVSVKALDLKKKSVVFVVGDKE